jgi:hypothetical protein
MQDAISEYSTESHYITKEDFYACYEKYCKKHAIPPEKFDNFCRILKNRFQFDDREKRPEINGKRVRVWAGILLNPDYAPITEQTRIL